MRILQASSSDIGGGAERIAWLLFEAYRQRGHESHLAVGKKLSTDPDVLLVSNEATREKSAWVRFWRSRHRAMQNQRWRGAWRLGRVFYDLAEPVRAVRKQLGHEDFDFPATRHLLRDSPQIFHAHNLHNGYFDLRLLPEISQTVPTVLTLHDEWLFTGHCGYSIDCPRWETGCGHCPDLTLYPAVKRDTTAYNWRRKARLYENSRLYISTPSQWLMDKVQRSMLAGLETRVIPYGVDLTVFQPADKNEAKNALEIAGNMVLFTGNRASQNPYKDYATVRDAVQRVQHPFTFVVLGDTGSTEKVSDTVTIRYVPYQKDLTTIARYYQAADLFLHAAHADNFPNTILESLACGTPVIATATGGIPEQIQVLEESDLPTGILVPPRDSVKMAGAIARLLREDELRLKMGDHAAADARRRFDLETFVQAYLNWYEDILSS